MKLDSNLNLVVPIRTNDNGETLIFGYHTPISRQVFEANYRILAAVKAELASKNIQYQMATGPIIAGLVLIDEAKKNAISDGDVDKNGCAVIDGAIALLADIKRLTMVLLPTETGWVSRPVDSAIATGQIDEDEWSEVESALVFFTCHCALVKRAQRAAMFKATSAVLQGVSTSLTLTEFSDSLPPLTKAEPSEVKVA